jgi:hypothetical protein
MEIPRRELENNSNAGQPCKFGECNEGLSEDNLDGGRHFKPSFPGAPTARTRKFEIVRAFLLTSSNFRVRCCASPRNDKKNA